jgi:hypothetical protein
MNKKKIMLFFIIPFLNNRLSDKNKDMKNNIIEIIQNIKGIPSEKHTKDILEITKKNLGAIDIENSPYMHEEGTLSILKSLFNEITEKKSNWNLLDQTNIISDGSIKIKLETLLIKKNLLYEKNKTLEEIDNKISKEVTDIIKSGNQLKKELIVDSNNAIKELERKIENTITRIEDKIKNLISYSYLYGQKILVTALCLNIIFHEYKYSKEREKEKKTIEKKNIFLSILAISLSSIGLAYSFQKE